MRVDLSAILASHLEAIEAGERTVEECLDMHPQHREALESLLTTALSVRASADYTPRPGYRQASRKRLVAKLRTTSPVTSGQLDRRIKQTQPLLMRRAVALVAVVLVMLVSLFGAGAVSASMNALPGDTLYGLKLAVENVRLGFSGPEEDTDLQVEFLQNRLSEIEALAVNNRNDDLYPALNPLSNQISNAAQALSSVARDDAEKAERLAILLDLALSRHTIVLEALLETAPDQARPAIEHAIQASSHGRQVIQNLFKNGMPGGGPPDGLPNPQATPKIKPTRKPTHIPPDPTRRPEGPPGLTKEPSKPTPVPGGPATERPGRP